MTANYGDRMVQHLVHYRVGYALGVGLLNIILGLLWHWLYPAWYKLLEIPALLLIVFTMIFLLVFVLLCIHECGVIPHLFRYKVPYALGATTLVMFSLGLLWYWQSPVWYKLMAIAALSTIAFTIVFVLLCLRPRHEGLTLLRLSDRESDGTVRNDPHSRQNLLYRALIVPALLLLAAGFFWIALLVKPSRVDFVEHVFWILLGYVCFAAVSFIMWKYGDNTLKAQFGESLRYNDGPVCVAFIFVLLFAVFYDPRNLLGSFGGDYDSSVNGVRALIAGAIGFQMLLSNAMFAQVFDFLERQEVVSGSDN